jgi:hypothetical protein
MMRAIQMRGSDAQKEIRGHSKKKYPRRNARARGISCGRKVEVRQHRKLGEADVYAVEERRHVADAHERQKPPRHFFHHLAFERGLVHVLLVDHETGTGVKV